MDNNINENTPDIGAVLAKLTSDPSMMEQISKIAETFKGSSVQSDDDNEAIQTSAVPVRSHSADNHFNMDQHTHLFNALKPYLNDERKSTLDYIMQLFSVIKLLEMSGINLNNILPVFNTTSSEE